MLCDVGGHWFFLPGMHCWQMGKWALPKQDMAHLSLCIRQVARLLRSLHDTCAEVEAVRPLHITLSHASYMHTVYSVFTNATGVRLHGCLLIWGYSRAATACVITDIHVRSMLSNGFEPVDFCCGQ